MRDGCSEADKTLGHKASCVECSFDQCHLDDKDWASGEARWPIRMLLMWYEGKGIQDIATKIGVSEDTVRRSLNEIHPQTWGPGWLAWWNQMLLERHNEGMSMQELTRVFKLDEGQISGILKEESSSSAQQRNNQADPGTKRHAGERGLPQELLDTDEFERWHKFTREMWWVMDGDPWVMAEGGAPNPLSPDTK